MAPEAIACITGALSHRGPDGWGIETRGAVAFGHRRLAIIDLEGGRQPFASEDGQVWVTFNGEIYNYRELRSELQAKGHRFRTSSDTEVVLCAYREWGEDCVRRFRGMFAFGIADFHEGRVFLARDQLGIKPLYYLFESGCLAFASEIQALRRLPGVRLTLDLPALDQYLRLQYIPAPRTAYREIRKLPPAHRMSVSFDGRVSEPQEYWRVAFRPQRGRRAEEWAEALEEVLRDSVRAHLVADVPFGAFLSGGVDSSAVVAYMAQLLDRPVRTFSIGFEEAEFDELDYAKQAARRWETDHQTEIVKPDALGILPDLVRHYGEPFGDSSAIPTYYVCRMARRSVPMVLSGDGGDEAFGGYDSYRRWLRWLAYEDMPGPAWRRALRRLAGRVLPHRFPRRGATLEGWLRFVTYIANGQRQFLWRPEYADAVAAVPLPFAPEFERAADFGACHKAQYLDIKSYLPYDILTKVDIASMAHGLEVRTPITDIRVIEFAATIPEELNVRKNGAGDREGKLLLKRVLQKYYPDDFLRRPKMGFAVPLKRWFAGSGAQRDELHERLLGADSCLREFFEPQSIRRLLDRNASGALWLLLFLEEWLRQNRAESFDPVIGGATGLTLAARGQSSENALRQ